MVKMKDLSHILKRPNIQEKNMSKEALKGVSGQTVIRLTVALFGLAILSNCTHYHSRW